MALFHREQVKYDRQWHLAAEIRQMNIQPFDNTIFCILGETPLHTAAIRGSSRLVKQLLQMGADPNAQDNAEWSPLHEACNRGNLGVVKVLLEFGADLNLKGFGKDSPLHDAARNGHIKVVKFLVKAGADLKAKNANNRTPREEAELTLLRIQDNPDLEKTVNFLIEQDEHLR